MKDLWISIRCWISWHAMPKDVRPIFVKAINEFADELLKELKEALEKTNQTEE